jgi:hypothetical protein
LFTRNIDKAHDFVNGMGARVLGMNQYGIRVRTDTGRALVVYPWTDEAGVTYFPIRLGYATTLARVQGATVAHMTVWLDVPNVEAAGYVALSRVRKDAHWRFVGDPTVHHFTPARQ